jgi:hypothetical protein
MSMPPSVDATSAVDEQCQVEFLGDVGAVGDVQPVDLLAVLAGLDGDQRVAEHVGCGGTDLVERARQADAALGLGRQFLELAFAATAGVDLRLDHPERPGELARGFDSLVDGHRGVAGGDRHAELGEQFLRLVFVDVHGRPLAVVIRRAD